MVRAAVIQAKNTITAIQRRHPPLQPCGIIYAAAVVRFCRRVRHDT
jgi:hypothetical protein